MAEATVTLRTSNITRLSDKCIQGSPFRMGRLYSCERRGMIRVMSPLCQREFSARHLTIRRFPAVGLRTVDFSSTPLIAKTLPDIWLLPMTQQSGAPVKPHPWLRTQFAELEAVFSPGGKWVAYQSNESGNMVGYPWQSSAETFIDHLY